MKIRGKLTGLSLLFGVVPLLVAAAASYISASGALHDSGNNQLSAIRDAKKQQIERYFAQIRDQVLTLSNSTMISAAMSGFSQAFRDYPQQAAIDEAGLAARRQSLQGYYADAFGTRYREATGKAVATGELMPKAPEVVALQAAYIADNPHPLGSKDNLDSAADGSDYAGLHARYHPVIRDYLRRFGYYDIFLVDADSGHIVYSVFKELDYATSLLDGPYASTNFAEAFRRAAAGKPGEAFLVDFAPYTPSYEAPASFIAAPIFDAGRRTGVLIFQMPVDRISEVLSQRTGMGASGEVYLVGADRLMRSNSRFDETTTILRKRVDTEGVRAAFAGVTDVATIDDYRGIPVLSAYAPVQIDGVDWAILAEIDEAEAFAAVSGLGWFMLALCALTVAVIAATGSWYARRMAAPIVQASDVAHNITQGSLDNPISAVGDDESAELLRALDAMQQDLKQRIQSEEQAAQNARIKAALDSVDTAVVATGADASVIYTNDAAVQLLRQLDPSFEDVAGRHFGQVVDGVDDALAGHGQARFEHRWSHRGRTVDVVGGAVRDSQGGFQGWVIQLVDRTEELAAAEAERARVERELASAAANTRIKVALDNVGSAVLVAGTDGAIIYANRSAKHLLHDAEAEIRSDIPAFNAAQLLGSSIDAFHGDASQAAVVLSTLRSPHQEDMELGGRSIRILANPVVDEEGRHLGTAVEWTDRTSEVAVEREIDALVEAASRGDLTHRIDIDGKEGFFRRLGSGFNTLLDQLSGVFTDIARVMGQLADGDLRSSIDNDYQGTFDAVKRDVNRTMENLREIVGKLTAVTTQVGSAVDEIASGNGNLSQRTEQQASSLQETASSLEELTGTVRNNADNAQQANQLAANARVTAQRGGDVVHEAVEAMAQISASSQKIGQIVGVIDEIAFQTNLLALNASVEAARAGEQGRGFAVVATEVRNLAGRSADAAKEIRELIRDAGNKVEIGAELVNTSGRSLSEIVDSVQKVGDIVAEIAAASAEQATGIDQVNRAVLEMDNITQQNAALAEQTSAASAAVGDNASELRQLVDFFRV